MSNFLATTAPDSVEEEIIDLPDADKETDVLRRATVKRVWEGVAYYGMVEDIEQGKDSGDRLYLVKYTDGDQEHFTADQVKELSCASEDFQAAALQQVPVASPASDVDEREKRLTPRNLLPLRRRRPRQQARRWF